MMMEQSVWCESTSRPTPQEDMISDETYKNMSNNCGAKIGRTRKLVQWMMESTKVLDQTKMKP